MTFWLNLFVFCLGILYVQSTPSIVFSGTAAVLGQYNMTDLTTNKYSYIAIPACVNSGNPYNINVHTGQLATVFPSMTPAACLQSCDAEPLCPGVTIRPLSNNGCFGRQLYTNTVNIPLNNLTVNNLLSQSTFVTYLKVPFQGIINNCADLAIYATGVSADCKDYPAKVADTTIQTTLAPMKIFDSSKPYLYSGCFKSVNTTTNMRTLPMNITKSVSQVTPASCAAACVALFYPLSGTEFGKHCFCGQYAPPESHGIDTLCNYGCIANSTISCGGNGYLDIYIPTPPTNFVDVATGVNVADRGCYSDFAANRLLSVPLNIPNSTPAKCVSACALLGHVIAGLEYGSECYCHVTGNDFPLSISSVDGNTTQFFQTTAAINFVGLNGNSCTMPCSGDVTKICGGSNFMNIYSWTATNTTSPNRFAFDPAVNPRSLKTQFVGCVADSTSNRVLPSNVVITSYSASTTYPYASLSKEICQEMCYEQIGFNSDGTTTGLGAIGYFGMAGGNECWCGQSLLMSPPLQSVVDCNIPCVNNTGQTCGGLGRMQVYSYQTSSIAGSTNPSIPEAYTYVGCYADSGYYYGTGYSFPFGTGRALSGMVRNYGGMSLSYCLNFCRKLGYLFMGLSASRICFCDNEIRPNLGPGTCTTGITPGEGFIGGGNSTSMAIWKVTPLPWNLAVLPGWFNTTNTVKSRYGGCIDDNINNRAFPYRQLLLGVLMTPRACIDACAFAGYTYSGLQYYSECWCSDTFVGVYGYSFNTNPCSTTMIGCAGNSSQQCGGPNIMAVYVNGLSSLSGIVSTSNMYVLQGCATDLFPTSRLFKNTMPTVASSLTVDICTTACAARGFPYAALEYGQECYCDTSFSGTLLSSNRACSTPCRGDATQFCGGSNSLAVYYNPSSVQLGIVGDFIDFKGQAVSFYGCFSDNSISLATRTFPTKMVSPAATMTPQSCILSCTNSGFSYAGLEYALECWCSNAQPSVLLQLTVDACKMPCTGAATLFCGAGNVLSVYRSVPPGSGTTVGNSGIGNSLGCFVDSTSDDAVDYTGGASLSSSSGHVLSGTRIDLGSSNTVEACIAACSSFGYTLAGVLNGISCYCDSTQRSSTTSVGCTVPCGGDSSELCGGVSAVQVYTTNSQTPAIVGSKFATVVTTASFYVGCAVDSVASRVLPVSTSGSTAATNTPRACLDACTRLGYVYAGVEFGSECWCGSTSPTLIPISRQAECAGKTCSGDSTLACGAGNRIAVYSNGNVAAQVTYLASSGNYQLVGCAADSVTSRTLSKQVFLTSGLMTVPSCVALCAAQNFYYAGVEYASECFCGSFFTASNIYSSNTSCSMPCAGASSTFCGGGNALNVYQNPSIVRSNIASYTSGSTTWLYKSCWREPVTGRALTVQLNNVLKTVQGCLDLGTLGGYTACGLEYGGECWCSQTAAPVAGTQVSEAYCSVTSTSVQYGMTCAGDYSRWCGAGNILSWYGTGAQTYTLTYNYP